MKTTGTKKPCLPPRINKVICANKGILTMSNITHITEANQVQISEHQLLRLLESIRTAKFRFAELQARSQVYCYASREHP